MSIVAQRIDLRPDHWTIVRDVLRRHVPARKVLAFGSRATWTAKEYSDLDLAILGDEPLSLDVTSALAERFSDSDLPFKVDLIDWTRIDEIIRDVIRRDGVAVQVPVNAHAAKEVKPKSASACKGWRNIPLGKIVELTLSSVDKKAKLHEEEVLLCNYMDVYSQRFIRDDLSFMTATATENEIRRCGLQSGDVVITKDSEQFDDIGVPALVRDDVSNLVCGYHLAILRPLEKLISGFYLYYALQAMNVQHQFHSYANGVTRFGLRKDDILRVEVPIPHLPEQRAIGHILGTLDDKIELNRRMNVTLEAMERAIFKDWFVDFGPTRAKAEDCVPHLVPKLWDLFPADLDSEEKPCGWESKPLDEIAEFLNGLALQKFPASDHEDSLPVIKIAELRGGITAKSNRASRDVPDKYVIKDGDFLFSWSGSLLAKFWTEGEGALNQHLYKVTSERYPAWFFSQWVLHHMEGFQSIAASKATTMGHIQRGHLKEAMTTCPPDDVLSILGQTVFPLVERITKNKLENRTLAQTRDLLLPKLMSGEIRIEEPEMA